MTSTPCAARGACSRRGSCFLDVFSMLSVQAKQQPQMWMRTRPPGAPSPRFGGQLPLLLKIVTMGPALGRRCWGLAEPPAQWAPGRLDAGAVGWEPPQFRLKLSTKSLPCCSFHCGKDNPIVLIQGPLTLRVTQCGPQNGSE